MINLSHGAWAWFKTPQLSISEFLRLRVWIRSQFSRPHICFFKKKSGSTRLCFIVKKYFFFTRTMKFFFNSGAFCCSFQNFARVQDLKQHQGQGFLFQNSTSREMNIVSLLPFPALWSDLDLYDEHLLLVFSSFWIGLQQITDDTISGYIYLETYLKHSSLSEHGLEGEAYSTHEVLRAVQLLYLFSDCRGSLQLDQERFNRETDFQKTFWIFSGSWWFLHDFL